MEWFIEAFSALIAANWVIWRLHLLLLRLEMAVEKPDDDAIKAQFCGALIEPVELRKIGYRLYAEDTTHRAYLGGLCAKRASVVAVALQMADQGLPLVSIVPAYDWRAFLQDTISRATPKG